jgi:hypothetical protein
MAMPVVYSNFCGRVVSETRGGVESDYVSDPLGSTIGLMNSAGTMTDRWEYWPYGEVVSRSGSNPTPLTFLGVIGYFRDVLDKLLYVPARHLRADLARWLTVDALWPASKECTCLQISVTVVDTGVSKTALPPIPGCCTCKCNS